MAHRGTRLAVVSAVIAIAVFAIAAGGATVTGHAQPAQPRRITFDKALPPMDGAHLNMKIVDVRYAPGDSGTPHRHGCAVAVYVIKGAVHMQVRGGVDSVYRQGEVFYESPTDIHQRSANASKSDSAHITATLVCDHNGPLTTPVP